VTRRILRVRQRTGGFAVTSFFLVISTAAALLLTSCTYRIATTGPSETHLLGRASGILSGQTSWDGTACLWIEEGRERAALVWPAGYTAGGKPLTVYDEGGTPVATVGKQVTLGGGSAPAGGILGCSGFRQAWVVGKVVR
jgi:hypothetical protein